MYAYSFKYPVLLMQAEHEYLVDNKKGKELI